MVWASVSGGATPGACTTAHSGMRAILPIFAWTAGACGGVDLHSLTRRERGGSQVGRASGYEFAEFRRLNSVPDFRDAVPIYMYLRLIIDNSYTREVFELPGGIPLPKLPNPKDDYTPQTFDFGNRMTRSF